MNTKLLFFFILILLVSCSSETEVENKAFIEKGNIEVNEKMVLEILSPEFNDKESIPKKFTCDGENVNPELNIRNIPKHAKTLALIMDDPDAPVGTWDHWIMWNIPIIEKIEQNSVPEGAVQGKNSWGKNEYGGPCPPNSEHRYIFKIYALTDEIDLPEDSDKSDLLEAIKEKIIEKAELTGLYKR